MMGNSGGVDPRLMEWASTIAVLKALSDPKSLGKAADELNKVYESIVASAAKMQQQQEAAAHELDVQKAAVEASRQEVAERHREFMNRESALAEAAAQHEKTKQDLAEKESRLLASQAEVEARQAKLKEQIEITVHERHTLNTQHTERMRIVEEERARLEADRAEWEAKTAETEAQRAHAAAAYNKRQKLMDTRQAALDAMEQSAMAAKLEYQKKLSDLRSLVGGNA